MTSTEIWLGENEYTRIDVRRQFKPSISIHQDGNGSLIISVGPDRNRIYDERIAQNGTSTKD